MSEYQAEVKLLSWTQNPLETLYYVWERNRDPKFDMSIEDIRRKQESDPEFAKKVGTLFRDLIETHLPLAEMADFVFWIQDVSLSLRGQMVRHRIGVKLSDEQGMGFANVPNLHDSTWWAQSMRALDLSEFYDTGHYTIPESIAQNPETNEMYQKTLGALQEVYKQLVAAGIPREDARQVIPLGWTHGLAWKINLASLRHLLGGKRTCWISQVGHWGPVITGIVRELRTKVHPYLVNLVNPPCIKRDQYEGCGYKIDNKLRIQGADFLTPCVLFCNKEKEEAASYSKEVDDPKWIVDDGTLHYNWDDSIERTPACNSKQEIAVKEKLAYDFSGLWQRDPYTGIRQEVFEAAADRAANPERDATKMKDVVHKHMTDGVGADDKG